LVEQQAGIGVQGGAAQLQIAQGVRRRPQGQALAPGGGVACLARQQQSCLGIACQLAQRLGGAQAQGGQVRGTAEPA